MFERECREASRTKASGEVEAFLLHAGAAIAEYRGDLMPGSYEDWALEHRPPLLRKCIDQCDDVTAGPRKVGTDLSSTRLRIPPRELQPLEEVGYRTLMSLQVAEGGPGCGSEYVSPLRRRVGTGAWYLSGSRKPPSSWTHCLDRGGEAAHRLGARAETVKSIVLVRAGGAGQKNLTFLSNDGVRQWLGTQRSRRWSRESRESGRAASWLELATIAASEGAAVATTRCSPASPAGWRFALVADCPEPGSSISSGGIGSLVARGGGSPGTERSSWGSRAAARANRVSRDALSTVDAW